jgi:2-polyprenyl-6-methoxyphenol hydroxylase-like FAD-dependent oxidoreductase
MTERIEATTTCCIAGGGPAGMMLGLLLARAGIDVTVLEKHGDFLRDFRGDTIHTSTITLMEELGLADRFLELPHQKARELSALVGNTRVRICDFSALEGPHPYILFMPQWDFLNFIASEAKKHAGFRLIMNAEAVGVIRAGERTDGVVYRQDNEMHTIGADLTVACDGRDSTLRRAGRLEPRRYGAPMDVMWFRLPRSGNEGVDTGAHLERGRMLVMIDRGDYWQMAYVIPKGTDAKVRAGGIEAFRQSVRDLSPFKEPAPVEAIRSWDDVKTLVVEINRLETWHRPGLLLIGDAAHAMSPVGGIGINLAIQDAVAAANILIEPLKARSVSEDDLAAVQARRETPTARTQLLQRIAQRRVIGTALAGGRPMRPPFWLPWLLAREPVKRRIARLIGIGLQAEHIGGDGAASAT